MVLVAGLGLSAAAPTAADDAFIATPHGMVGMQQEIGFKAPSLAGQVATIGFVSGNLSNAGQTPVNDKGFGWQCLLLPALYAWAWSTKPRVTNVHSKTSRPLRHRGPSISAEVP